jgi:hypothetical protein
MPFYMRWYMPVSITRYKVLLSSPGDATGFCDVADEAIEAINRTHSDTTGIEFHTVDWRRDSRSDSGAEPQALLNRQIVDEADIALAILYKRFGTPTKSYGSGTEEEIRRALDQGKPVMLYTWQAPAGFEPEDPGQYEKIASLRKSLGSLVMYSFFSDETSLYQKVQHDFTKLLFELEGKETPKPALSLASVGASGSTEETLQIRQGISGTLFNPDTMDGAVRKALGKVRSIAIAKPKPAQEVAALEPTAGASGEGKAKGSSITIKLPESQLGSIAKSVAQLQESMKPRYEIPEWARATRMTFDEADKAAVLSELETMGLSVDDDLFDLGDLAVLPSLVPDYLGGGSKLSGTDAEKARYEALEDLVSACRLRREYRAFLESFDGVSAISLALVNAGGSPAHHVSIEVAIPSEWFVPHDKAPVPGDFFIGHGLYEGALLDEFAERAYALDETAGCLSYDASRVRIESGVSIPPMHQTTTYGITPGRRYLDGDDYRETVDWLFDDYRVVDADEGRKKIIRIEFDKAQQSKAYSFPTVILVRSGFQETLKYSITADEIEKPIDGEIGLAVKPDETMTAGCE